MPTVTCPTVADIFFFLLLLLLLCVSSYHWRYACFSIIILHWVFEIKCLSVYFLEFLLFPFQFRLVGVERAREMSSSVTYHSLSDRRYVVSSHLHPRWYNRYDFEIFRRQNRTVLTGFMYFYIETIYQFV